MAQQLIINNLKNALLRFRNLDLKKFYRDHLGVNSLRSVEPILLDLSEKVNRAEKFLESLWDQQVNWLLWAVNLASSEIEKTFNYQDAAIPSLINEIQNRFNSIPNNLMNVWPQILAVINDKPEIAEIWKETEEWLRKVKKYEKQIESIKDRLEKKLAWLETLTDQTSTKLQINQQADNYVEIAQKSLQKSHWWLISSIVISFLLVLYISCLINGADYSSLKPSCFITGQNFDEITNLLVSKNPSLICSKYDEYIFFLNILKILLYRWLLIGIWIYALNLSLKNYNALMHNYFINKQRANSLWTAIILLHESINDEGKNSILNNALQNIVSHQETWYTKTAEIKNGISVTEKIMDKIIDKIP